MRPPFRHHPSTPPLFPNGPIAMRPQDQNQPAAIEDKPATSEPSPPLREATTLPPAFIEPIEGSAVPPPLEQVPAVTVTPISRQTTALPCQVLERAMPRRPVVRQVTRRRRPNRLLVFYYLIAGLIIIVLLVMYVLYAMPEAR